jgi:chromosome segregation ATPase
MGRNSHIGIRRSLFGYRRSVVHELLLESDYMQRRAESNILSAEVKITELQAELGDLEREVAGRDQRLAELQAEVARLEDRTTDAGPSFVTDEVTSILTAAHDAAARIVERARSVSDRMHQANRREDGVRADATRLAAWRDDALPVFRMVRSSIDEIRAELEGIARRIVEALTPLEGLAAIDETVISEDEAVDAVELGEREGELEALRVIEPRSERRGRAPSRVGRSSGRSRPVGELTG